MFWARHQVDQLLLVFSACLSLPVRRAGARMHRSWCSQSSSPGVEPPLDECGLGRRSQPGRGRKCQPLSCTRLELGLCNMELGRKTDADCLLPSGRLAPSCSSIAWEEGQKFMAHAPLATAVLTKRRFSCLNVSSFAEYH